MGTVHVCLIVRRPLDASAWITTSDESQFTEPLIAHLKHERTTRPSCLVGSQPNDVPRLLIPRNPGTVVGGIDRHQPSRCSCSSSVACTRSYNSGAQAKVVDLEAELESTRNTLSEARRELAESRRNAKVGLTSVSRFSSLYCFAFAVLRAPTSLNRRE